MGSLAVTVANTIRDNMQKDTKEQNEKKKARMEANQNKNKVTRRCWKCNVMGHIPADHVCKPEDIAAEDGKRSQPHNPVDIPCAQPSGRRLPRPEKIESEQPALTNEALMAMMQTLITVMRACTPSHIGIPCLTQSLYRTLRDTTNQNHGAVGQTTTFVASPLRTGQHLGCTLGVQTEDMGTPGWERQVPPKQSATQTESSSLTEDDMVGNREGGAEASAHDHWAVTRTRATNYERPSPEGSHSGASTTSTAQCRVPVETAESREPQSEQGEGLGSDKSTDKLVQTTSTIERDPSVNKASYDAEFDHPTAPQIKLLELARKWRHIGDVLQRRPHPDVVKKRGWECVTQVARVLCVPVANVIEKALRSIRNRSKSMFDRPNTLGDGEQLKTDTEGSKRRWIERTVDNGSYASGTIGVFPSAQIAIECADADFVLRVDAKCPPLPKTVEEAVDSTASDIDELIQELQGTQHQSARCPRATFTIVDEDKIVDKLGDAMHGLHWTYEHGYDQSLGKSVTTVQTNEVHQNTTDPDSETFYEAEVKEAKWYANFKLSETDPSEAWVAYLNDGQRHLEKVTVSTPTKQPASVKKYQPPSDLKAVSKRMEWGPHYRPPVKVQKMTVPARCKTWADHEMVKEFMHKLSALSPLAGEKTPSVFSTHLTLRQLRRTAKRAHEVLQSMQKGAERRRTQVRHHREKDPKHICSSFMRWRIKARRQATKDRTVAAIRFHSLLVQIEIMYQGKWRAASAIADTGSGPNVFRIIDLTSDEAANLQLPARCVTADGSTLNGLVGTGSVTIRFEGSPIEHTKEAQISSSKQITPIVGMDFWATKGAILSEMSSPLEIRMGPLKKYHAPSAETPQSSIAKQR